jgi:general stress protein 26
VAGLAFTEEAKKAEQAKAPEKAAAMKSHEANVEIVSVAADGKTITIKGEKENKTYPVDEKAIAAVKKLKAGEKATLLCRDNEKGEHVAVAGVKAPETK